MFQGNPQATGRSKYAGPSQGVIAWVADYVYAYRSIAVADSFIVGGDRYGFRAYNFSDGSVRFNYNVPEGWDEASPAVLYDNSVVAQTYGLIRRFRPNGTEMWSYDPKIPNERISCDAISIGRDTTIYFCTITYHYGTVHKLDANGKLLWKYSSPTISSHGVITMSPDGNILYVTGGNGNLLHAFDSHTGTLKWTFGQSMEYLYQSPMVDSKGNIYVMHPEGEPQDGKPAIYCLNPDGTIKWKFIHGNSFEYACGGEMCMDYSGNIYFALDTLYTITYNGNLRWKRDLDGFADAPVVCDVNGYVYIVRYARVPGQGAIEVICFTSLGDIKWKVDLPFKEQIWLSPALTKNGLLILPTYKGTKLIAIQ
jgi:outer membrane protein assembly factor BamB